MNENTRARTVNGPVPLSLDRQAVMWNGLNPTCFFVRYVIFFLSSERREKTLARSLRHSFNYDRF